MRNIISLTLIVAAFFVGDRIIAWGMTKLVSESEFRISKLYSGRAHASIVVIGNSRSVHAVHAPTLEETVCQSVMHMGYNGMPIDAIQALLRDYYELNEPPDLVLIEASASNRNRTFSEVLKPFVPPQSWASNWLEGTSKHDQRISQLFWLYRFNSESFWRSLYYLGRSDQDWIIKGQQVRPAQLQGFKQAQRPATQSSREAVDWTTLKRIAAQAKELGTKVEYFRAPIHPVLWANDIQRQPLSLGFPQHGLSYYDGSHTLEDNAHFADVIHSNLAGAQAFQSLLIANTSLSELSCAATNQVSRP